MMNTKKIVTIIGGFIMLAISVVQAVSLPNQKEIAECIAAKLRLTGCSHERPELANYLKTRSIVWLSDKIVSLRFLWEKVAQSVDEYSAQFPGHKINREATIREVLAVLVHNYGTPEEIRALHAYLFLHETRQAPFMARL